MSSLCLILWGQSVQTSLRSVKPPLPTAPRFTSRKRSIKRVIWALSFPSRPSCPVIWADTSGDEWMRVYTRSTVHSTSFTSNHWIDFNFYVFSDPNLTSKTPACRMFRAISEKHRYLHDIEIYRISLQGFASLIIGSSSSQFYPSQTRAVLNSDWSSCWESRI